MPTSTVTTQSRVSVYPRLPLSPLPNTDAFLQQCRTRKQRCLPSSATTGLQAPCKRCQQHGITCSFETDQVPGPDVSPSPSRMAQLIVDLQRRYVSISILLQAGGWLMGGCHL
jgi:hypothetical protein